MSIKNYYAVVSGYESMVIVETWTECEKLIKGFPGAKFKGFFFRGAAKDYLDQNKPKDIVKPRGRMINNQLVLVDNPVRFIPATSNRDKFGYFKPRYYIRNSVRMADHGTTIGIFYVESDDESRPF